MFLRIAYINADISKIGRFRLIWLLLAFVGAGGRVLAPTYERINILEVWNSGTTRVKRITNFRL